MGNNLKTTLTILCLVLSIGAAAITDSILKTRPVPNRQELTEGISKTVIDELLEDLSFESVAIFLYTGDYRIRYLLASTVDISNPYTVIQGDYYYTDLLERNKRNICTIVPTMKVPQTSKLYDSLKANNRVKPGVFYGSCPIFTSKGFLIGYISTVIERDEIGLVENLQTLKFYSIIVGEELDLLF